MAKHQMPNDQRDQNKSMPGGKATHGNERDRDRGAQQMGSNPEQQRQSPGRGDEGKGRDSGGDRR